MMYENQYQDIEHHFSELFSGKDAEVAAFGTFTPADEALDGRAHKNHQYAGKRLYAVAAQENVNDKTCAESDEVLKPAGRLRRQQQQCYYIKVGVDIAEQVHVVANENLHRNQDNKPQEIQAYSIHF